MSSGYQGFFHDFLSLGELAEVQHKYSEFRNRTCESSLHWDEK